MPHAEPEAVFVLRKAVNLVPQKGVVDKVRAMEEVAVVQAASRSQEVVERAVVWPDSCPSSLSSRRPHPVWPLRLRTLSFPDGPVTVPIYP